MALHNGARKVTLNYYVNYCSVFVIELVCEKTVFNNIFYILTIELKCNIRFSTH